MHPHHIAMLEAIKSKRGKGLDVHMLMGQDKPNGKESTEEMAPDAAPVDESSQVGTKDQAMEKMIADEESNESPAEKAMELKHPEMEKAEHEQMQNKLQSSSDHEMMGHVGPDEMPSHKPRSLGERAKMALMMRMKK